MKKAILVDCEYFEMLECLHEEVHQARTADSVAWAKQNLRAAMATAEQITQLLEGK